MPADQNAEIVDHMIASIVSLSWHADRIFNDSSSLEQEPASDEAVDTFQPGSSVSVNREDLGYGIIVDGVNFHSMAVWRCQILLVHRIHGFLRVTGYWFSGLLPPDTARGHHTQRVDIEREVSKLTDSVYVDLLRVA